MNKPVLIITGAASGIGLAAARLLSARYFIVSSHHRTPMPENDSARIRGVDLPCDVADFNACEELVAEAERHGPVAGLVHGAGINMEPPVSVADMDVSAWDHIIRTNLYGAFHMAKAVIPALRRNRGGSMVLVSSTAGRKGFSTAGGLPGRAKVAYATSKAGVIALARGLAAELAGENIRVNCMAPGPIDTRMLVNRDVAVPQGRIGTPEEAARAIAFLLDDATFTTGCTLDVCGGLYMN